MKTELELRIEGERAYRAWLRAKADGTKGPANPYAAGTREAQLWKEGAAHMRLCYSGSMSRLDPVASGRA